MYTAAMFFLTALEPSTDSTIYENRTIYTSHIVAADIIQNIEDQFSLGVLQNTLS